VTFTRRSTLSEVAGGVARALADAGIRGVLTGGACATLYTRGVYQSADLDFVLQSAVTLRHPIDLDIVRAWSNTEGHGSEFEEFRRELQRARQRRSRR
jgi:hypothetical protein